MIHRIETIDSGATDGIAYRGKRFAIKYALPAILIVAGSLMMVGPTNVASIGAGVILLMCAIFGLTTAELRSPGDFLEYRRFLNWHRVAVGEAKGCRVSLVPGIGRLTLRRFVLPWGAIYFVLPSTGVMPAWPGGHTQFTRHVAEKLASTGSAQSIEGKDDGSKRAPRTRDYIFPLLIGCLWSVMLYFLVPNFPPSRESSTSTLGKLVRGEHEAVAWPWGLVLCGALLLGLTSARKRFVVWILAFCLGALVISVLVTSFR